MTRPAAGRASFATVAFLACACNVEPETRSTPTEPPAEPASTPVERESPRVGAHAAAARLRTIEAPEPAITTAAAPATAPPRGVASIVAAATPDAVRLLVAEDGGLRILERQGASFDDVGALRLPSIDRVHRAFGARLSGETLAVLVLADGRLRVLVRDPGGVFVDRSAESLPGEALDSITWVAPADLDDDGDVDLALATATGTRILENDGADRFVDRTESHLPVDAPGGARVLVMDVDGDLAPDLLAIGPGIHVLANDGRGRFTDRTAVAFPVSPPPTHAAVAMDADQDLDVDLVLLRGDAPDEVWSNDGRGRFLRAPDGFLSTARSTAGATGDLDGDGSPDLATVGPDGLVLRIAADGARLHAEPWRTPGALALPLREVDIADVDLDGDLDLVLGGAPGLAMLTNDGLGRFVDATALLLPARDQSSLRPPSKPERSSQ